MKSLVIHHRDYRINDNLTLIQAIKDCSIDGQIYPIFIFDDKQIDPKQNKYFSSNCFNFLLESLFDLFLQYKKFKSNIGFYYGITLDVINDLITKHSITDIYMHRDITPFSKKRDNSIQKLCEELEVKCHFIDDLLLTKDIKTGSGTIYHVYTPFYREASKHTVNKPINPTKDEMKKVQKNTLKSKFLIKLGEIKNEEISPMLEIHGGRTEALKKLELIEKGIYENYKSDREFPILDKTTHLSAYLKFGCISIREAYWTTVNAYGKNHPLIMQYYWREFYYYILDNYPDNLGHAMRTKYDDIKWWDKPEWLKAWKEGKTGCPIVDAGMRQMNMTGFMHNRLRMIVSNFLIKDLHIDWREGEKYFAQMLVDYDVPNNNGGWQWSAGTGTDSQPYFRIFNPYTQSEKFDKDAEYIKKWVPELKDIPSKDIHNWENSYSKYKDIYIKPLVIHSEEREKTLDMYKEAV